MTRGIIVFIDKDGSYRFSTEFNGDMHSYRNGQEIIDAYKSRTLMSQSDYEKFIYAFDNRHYGYSAAGYELTNSGIFTNQEVVLDLFPDYFYIINHSGDKIVFRCHVNTFEVEDDTLMVTDFEEVEQVIKCDVTDCSLISKQRFCEIMKRLKADHDFIRKMEELVRTYDNSLGFVVMPKACSVGSHDDMVIELLKVMFHDQAEIIERFSVQFDFGRKYQSGDLIIDGQEVKLKTAEDLYEYLSSTIK